MKNLSLIALLAFLFSCQSTAEKAGQETEAYQQPSHHTQELTAIFDAHGSYEQWNKMKTLSYMKGEESTITNLKNRKIRVESPSQTIGFDGEEVWVTPDSADVSRARFYHNLYFYFYAMPFVVGDPGAFYETVDARVLAGKRCNGIKISYGENIGDAPDDNYILWYDPETKQMEWLMYTVTYRSGEPSDDYHLIKYNDWQKFNGVVLPTSLQWYEYKNDSVGDPAGDPAVFTRIELYEEAPADELFKRPENSVIAPLTGAAEKQE